MAGRRLLLLLLLAGALRAARCCPGDPDPDPGPAPAAAAAPPGPPPPPAAAALGALLRSLQRPGRAPGPLLRPQSRFGRGPQGGSQARLSPRSWDAPAAPFWTMATPQRFGRRR